MKKYLISLGLFCLLPSITTTKPAMPSVSDVFGGMSQDELLKQVEMGQKFLEDMEKNGTPEEKAQFERLMLETLNSMSEDDFNNLGMIAKQVEPYIKPPETAPSLPQPVQKVPEEKVDKASTQETNAIKALIDTLMQRLDDMMQKIESCKECSQEFNVRWKNKATLQNMKRQIKQLRTDRLAEKLSKKDLSDDDKALVASLEAFKKDLTSANDSFVLEDNFGLPESRAVEQKLLKQTKDFLVMIDSHIDSIMPKVEKFLSKWDPEALQLAKEAETASKKALEGTVQAHKRSPSADARESMSPRDFYPERADRSSYPYNTGSSAARRPSDSNVAPSNTPVSTSSESMPAASQPVAPAVKKADTPAVSPEKIKNESMALVEPFQDHLDMFNIEHEKKSLDFINGLSYPLIPEPLGNPEKAYAWVTTTSAPIIQSMTDNLHTLIKRELSSMRESIKDVTTNIKDAAQTAVDKLSESPVIQTIEKRYEQYKNAFLNVKKSLDDSFAKNMINLQDMSSQATYTKQHDTFISELKDQFENGIDDITNGLSYIKRKLRRQRQMNKAIAS